MMLPRSRPKNPTSKSNSGPRRFSGLGTQAMVSLLVNFTLYKNKFILVFGVVPKICWPITCCHLLQKYIYTHCTKDASIDSYRIKYIASPKTCKVCVTWSPNSQITYFGPQSLIVELVKMGLDIYPYTNVACLLWDLHVSSISLLSSTELSSLSSLFPETAAVAIELPQSLMPALALAHAAPFPHGYPSP